MSGEELARIDYSKLTIRVDEHSHRIATATAQKLGLPDVVENSFILVCDGLETLWEKTGQTELDGAIQATYDHVDYQAPVWSVTVYYQPEPDWVDEATLMDELDRAAADRFDAGRSDMVCWVTVLQGNGLAKTEADAIRLLGQAWPAEVEPPLEEVRLDNYAPAIPSYHRILFTTPEDAIDGELTAWASELKLAPAERPPETFALGQESGGQVTYQLDDRREYGALYIYEYWSVNVCPSSKISIFCPMTNEEKGQAIAQMVDAEDMLAWHSGNITSRLLGAMSHYQAREVSFSGSPEQFDVIVTGGW